MFSFNSKPNTENTSPFASVFSKQTSDKSTLLGSRSNLFSNAQKSSAEETKPSFNFMTNNAQNSSNQNLFSLNPSNDSNLSSDNNNNTSTENAFNPSGRVIRKAFRRMP